MSFEEYMNQVSMGKVVMQMAIKDQRMPFPLRFPSDPRVPVPPIHANKAGVIINAAYGRFSHLAIIESFAGVIRSNHYHKTDSHFMTPLDGKMEYYWQETDENGKGKGDVKAIQVERGNVIFTPPMVIHAVFFPTPSRILALSDRVRTHEEHEADLVRDSILELVDGRPHVVLGGGAGR